MGSDTVSPDFFWGGGEVTKAKIVPYCQDNPCSSIASLSKIQACDVRGLQDLRYMLHCATHRREVDVRWHGYSSCMGMEG
jgi:hypothetical protein